MKGKQGIYKGFEIHRIVPVFVYETPVQRSTIDKHGLVCGRRTKFVSLSPVRKSIIIVFLLVILVVVRQILDTFGTVRTIFTLSGSNARPCQHENDREEQKDILFHIQLSLFSLNRYNHNICRKRQQSTDTVVSGTRYQRY